MVDLIKELMSKSKLISCDEVFTKLLNYGEEKGYIANNYDIVVPDLVSYSEDICQTVLSSLNNYFSKNGKSIYDSLHVFFGWCIYMGMGVTYLYKNNTYKLSIMEMCSKIINERSIGSMDEYVLDLINIGYGTDEANRYTSHFQLIGQVCIFTLPINDSFDKVSKQIIETSKALFLYGSAIELNRLKDTHIEDVENNQILSDDIVGNDYIKAEELYINAEKFRDENKYDEARALYNQSYNLGWAPSKHGLFLVDPDMLTSTAEAARLYKDGLNISLRSDSDPIDSVFCERIEGYVKYLIDNSRTDEALDYLYNMLFEKHDRKSVKTIFEIYKNRIDDIDRTSYDYNKELRLLDRLIDRSYLAPEAKIVKNNRFKKKVFSNMWEKK